MNKNNNRFSFLFDNPDQEAVTRELALYFGHNPGRYLETYRLMQRKRVAGYAGSLIWRFNWAAFLASFAWFFYRKMYLPGVAVMALPLLIRFLFRSPFDLGDGVAIAVFFASWADYCYVRLALGRIEKAQKLGLAGDERREYLQRAGDVSVAGGFLGGFVVLFSVGVSAYVAMRQAYR